MATPIIRADLGRTTTIDAPTLVAGPRLVAISRLACTHVSAAGFSTWLQLRGTTSVASREGRFRLLPGDWLALDAESLPTLQAGRNGLLLGLVLPGQAFAVSRHMSHHALYPGRGHCHTPDRIIAARMWREAADRMVSQAQETAGPRADPLAPILAYLASLQQDIHRDLGRCPGKSRMHKAKIFGRLQRARLFLEGNDDRIVRLDELARQTSFSRWYLSKAFQATYGESLQDASRRMRMERACRLLAETTLSICEVSALCGFENPCSFARSFRSHTGTTSTRYRRSHRAAPLPQRQRQTPTGARKPRIEPPKLASR
ncbi:helix-turn-helix domain-containing protein [Luteimonas saliphila]|uniref:helix-turn-helix domain-containing protein n=1 Tax=Luteimonas saliphila TaxID=2804919 RepID=UPI00192DC70A|nr:AraC family transcriptional regulator [Luteimonas saliphila]